jgi:coproporphyrinogen III oxidase-like Fe-S oxidoreductase
MLGLRLTDGIDVAAFQRRFETDALEMRRAAIEDLVAAGLVSGAEGRLRLTDRALLVANDVVCRLL